MRRRRHGMKKSRLIFRSFLPAIGMVASVYLAVFTIMPPSVFWSPDEGCKFLQMYGWVDEGIRGYDFTYPGEVLDPGLAFYPSGYIYPRSVSYTHLRAHET